MLGLVLVIPWFFLHSLSLTNHPKELPTTSALRSVRTSLTTTSEGDRPAPPPLNRSQSLFYSVPQEKIITVKLAGLSTIHLPHRSDLWACGCVLYELATLRHAFQVKIEFEILTVMFHPSRPPCLRQQNWFIISPLDLIKLWRLHLPEEISFMNIWL